VAPRNPIRRIEDGSTFHARTDWIMSVLFLCAAAAAGFYFGFPRVVDPNAADFNGFAFVSVALFLIALRYAIPAIRGTLRGRRFGRSVMEMEGQTVAPGGTLKGVIRIPANLEPLGDYEVRLQCVEQVVRGQTTTTPSAHDQIRMEETLRVSAQAVKAAGGIPFAFMIPRDARMTTVPMGDLLLTGDVSGSIRWILEVKAPMKGLDFYAIFGVEVASAARPARRKVPTHGALARDHRGQDGDLEEDPGIVSPLSLDLFDARLRTRGLERDRLVPADGIATMVDLYRTERAAGYKVPDEDILLFQWGTYVGRSGQHFELDITRQFTSDQGAGDKEVGQLSLTFFYRPAANLRALDEGHRWCRGFPEIERFEKFIGKSAAMKIVGSAAAKSVTLRYVSL